MRKRRERGEVETVRKRKSERRWRHCKNRSRRQLGERVRSRRRRWLGRDRG